MEEMIAQAGIADGIRIAMEAMETAWPTMRTGIAQATKAAIKARRNSTSTTTGGAEPQPGVARAVAEMSAAEAARAAWEAIKAGIVEGTMAAIGTMTDDASIDRAQIAKAIAGQEALSEGLLGTGNTLAIVIGTVIREYAPKVSEG